MSEVYKKLKGVTLLEMMISIAILSMVMASLAYSVYETNAFSSKAQELLHYRQKTRIIFNLFKSDLRSAVYLKNHALRPQGQGETGIIGEKTVDKETDINRIYLHVHKPGKLVNQFETIVDPEVHEIAYFSIKNPDNDLYSLYRSEKFYITPVFEKITPLNQQSILRETLTRRNILLNDKIMSFKIVYVEGLKADGTPNESTSWNSKTKTGAKMPESVRIEVTQKGKDDEEIIDKFLVSIRPELGQGVIWDI